MRNWNTGTTVPLLLLGLLAVPAGAEAQECASPRGAVASWLDNLQEDSWAPGRAVACFDWAGSSVEEPAEREQRAIRLKRVLDARGLYVDLDALPDSGEAGGRSELRPFERELPKFRLVRKGSRWLIASSTIEAVPSLHEATFAVDVRSYVDQLPEWTRDPALFHIAWWQVLGLLACILLGLMVRLLVTWILASQSARLLKRSGDSADSSVLGDTARPIGTLVMAGVLWYLLPLLQFGPRLTQTLNIALRVVAAASAVMLLYRFVDLLSNVFARRAEQTETKLDDQLVPLVRKTLKVFVIALGIIFVLQNMDVDVGSLLAGASLGGLAFTLAARDTVANLFGSVSIFTDKPFQIGDWVVVSGYEGIVEEVGMRSTRIRTFYNSLVTMPNHIIANTTVDNYGARQYKRCFATLGVTYDTSPEQLQGMCEGIRAILAANPRVRKDFYEVHFSGFGSHALEIMVYFFFETDSWSDELHQRHNVFMEIVRLAKDLNVSFAFPTQSLHVESMAEPTAKRTGERPTEEALAAVVQGYGPRGERARPGGPRLTHGFLPGTVGRAGSEGEGSG